MDSPTWWTLADWDLALEPTHGNARYTPRLGSTASDASSCAEQKTGTKLPGRPKSSVGGKKEMN